MKHIRNETVDFIGSHDIDFDVNEPSNLIMVARFSGQNPHSRAMMLNDIIFPILSL